MPLLSICIPTYNRCDNLNRSIETIVNNNIFEKTNYIEILVSDNASNDDTMDIMQKYIQKYPNKIRYYRNKVNLKDENFAIILSMATGVFRKLSNDNILYSEKSLCFMIFLIKKYIKTRPLLFFSNGHSGSNYFIHELNSIDDFFVSASFYTTWIGAFGLWEDQLDVLQKNYHYHKTQLLQVKLIYEILMKNPKAIVINKVLFVMDPIENKSSYDVFKVFGFNYFQILNEYKMNITKEHMNREKKMVLFNHLIPYYCNFGKTRKSCKYSYKCLFNAYKYDYYFYLTPFVVLLWFISYKFGKYVPQKIKNIIRGYILH